MTSDTPWFPLLVGAVCAPLVVAMVVLAGDGWHPTGDMAQAELHVRGFFAHPPLLGAAGRFGTIAEQGSHPGPAPWLVLLPGYRLLGQSGWALEASAAALAAGSAVGILAIARRRGGWALTVTAALGLAVLIRSNGPEVFTEPWNPWLAVLPFAAFVLLVWSVLCDDRPALVWAVVAGSFAVQSHIGYALMVGGLGAIAAAWALRRRWWRPLAIGALAGVLLWLPPVIEQLGAGDGWPGNARILWDDLSGRDQEPLGVTAAIETFAEELNIAGPWLIGHDHEPTEMPVWPGLIAMSALWGAAAAVAWRRRLDHQLRLHAVLAVACALGIATIARISGDFFYYLIRWTWVLSALVAVAVGWTAWTAANDQWRRGLAKGAGAALAAALIAASVGAVDVESSGERNSEIVAALTPRVAERLDGDGQYLVRWTDNISLGAAGVGVLLELEKRGFDVGTDAPHRAAVLPHRIVGRECTTDGIIEIVVGSSVDDVRRRPGAEEVAIHDPRNAVERRRFDETAARLDAALRKAGAEDLTPAADHVLVVIRVDPRLPKTSRDDLHTLYELGLPAHAFVMPPPPCDPPSS